MHDEIKIGKRELTEWIETLLNRKNFEFKNLKDGDIYLQLFELIWPNVMKKYKNCIQINPINDINKKKNWKIIKNVLNFVNIDKSFINYDEIVADNFKECYQSLIILYFLYSLVKNHECDFVLAYPIDQKLTDFMSSEEPLTCLVRAGSVQLPENFFEKISNSTVNLNNLIKVNEKDINYSKTNLPINENFNESKDLKENPNYIDKLDYDDNFDLKKYITNYHNNEYGDLKKESDTINDFRENFNLDKDFAASENLNNNNFLNSLNFFDFSTIESKNKKENCAVSNNSNNSNNNIINNNSINNNNNNSNVNNDNIVNSIKNDDFYNLNFNKKYIDEYNSHLSNNDNFSFSDKYDLNLKKKIASNNLSDTSVSNNGSFFKYFNNKREEYDNYKNKLNDNNKKILSVPNLNLFKLPYINDNTHNEKKNIFLNLKKNKVDASCQTENDSILNELLNRESTMDLEIVWDDKNKKVKGDSFVFFLKTQIKMYKKELGTKREELELIQKINKKTINDIKTSYNSELKKLKEKYEADIFYLKQQHLENITIVRKAFESKLNHIEEDLLLDLDVLNSENKNIISSNENRNILHTKDQQAYNNYENKENIDYGLNTNVGNFLFDKKMFAHDNITESVDSTIKDNNNNNNNISKKNIFLNVCYNNEKEDEYRKEKDKDKEELINEEINKKKIINLNNTDYYMNNNIESSIKKLKYLLNEKNKEHVLNNEFIKNEILNLRSMLSKTVLEKEKKYNDCRVSNEIFHEILEYIEKNIDKKNIDESINNDFYVEKIKNNIYNIIKDKKECNVSKEQIIGYLNEDNLINLIIHISSLLRLERTKTEVIKIQKERNNFIMNYVKNENGSEYLLNKKNNAIYVGEEYNKENTKILSNEIPNKEIENFEKEMELDEKIKRLEYKNKRLLSINEYYKKKLEHVEIWKSTLENFKKKCENFNNVGNTIDPSENKNYNFAKMKEIAGSNNATQSSLIWFPQFYLKSFKEETERDAELMYLLKKLGRYEKDQDLSIFENPNSFNFSTNRCNIKNNELFLPPKKNKICSIYNYRNCNSNNEDNENNQENNKFPHINQNEFLIILKKKLTYIFWQMLGDIYKYRNIVHDACNYIYNLNNLLNEYILKNEQIYKEAKENFDLCCKNKENFYLSEKYKLRKIIGITKLNMEIYKEQYIELKKDYEKEKKNLTILTNACYENENKKYKTTIQKFKEIDMDLKVHKIREKKWNKLVKLLTIELRNSSKGNQEEIKNIWMEIIATKQITSQDFKKLNDENLQKSNDNHSDSDGNSNNFASIIDNFNGQNKHINNILDPNKNKGKKLVVNKKLSSNKMPHEKHLSNYKKQINNTNLYSNKSIVHNKSLTALKQGKADTTDNVSSNNNSSNNDLRDKKHSNEINFYKKDFNICLDDIENNDIVNFCSTNELDNLITDKDQIFIDFKVEEDKNKELNSNNILKIADEYPLKINNCDLRNVNDAKLNKNWFNLLSQMAKESCIMFQNILNLKEEELDDKKNKINELEKKIRELKEENMNQKNKFKCLEEQHQFLIDKLNFLNEDVDNLNLQIFSLNKEKIYLESRYLTKQQEFSIIINNYKSVIDSIRNHIKKYSSILYLLDNLPEKDEKIILDLANIDRKSDKSLNFSLDIDKNLELKNNEITNDDIRIKIDAKDSNVLTNFSKLKISKLDDKSTYPSDLYIDDLIKDIKCANFK